MKGMFSDGNLIIFTSFSDFGGLDLIQKGLQPSTAGCVTIRAESPASKGSTPTSQNCAPKSHVQNSVKSLWAALLRQSYAFSALPPCLSPTTPKLAPQYPSGSVPRLPRSPQVSPSHSSWVPGEQGAVQGAHGPHDPAAPLPIPLRPPAFEALLMTK